MKPFSAPIDDILFSLQHIAGAPSLEMWDAELSSEIADHFARFAEEKIAPLNEIGDTEGCTFKDGRVYMPSGFKQAYTEYCDDGWGSLSVPEEYGGQELGVSSLAITSEIFAGANHSLQMVVNLAPSAIRTILKYGTSEQQETYIAKLTNGEALATMCLSEADAGSDLSRIRCKAEQGVSGWAINGEKIFISGGDQDLSEEIFHLVLARTSNDGIRGLSLFICPSHKSDGSRNTVSVTRIEEKMGLHASPTCQLAFDAAEAEMLGEEGQGLAALFTMMNHARADVALQGAAHAARAYDIASTYAAERKQGKTAEGTAATLDQHYDVKLMLSEIDFLVLSGRAMAHMAFVMMESESNPDLLDFITPIVKVFCSSGGMKATELGMQVLGGYGYLREYHLEQCYRDVRITAIYEGANGILARSLASRNALADAGIAFESFAQNEAETFNSQLIEQALQRWQEARNSLAQADDKSALAADFMTLSSNVLLAIICEKFNAAAQHHPDPERILRAAEFIHSRLKGA